MKFELICIINEVCMNLHEMSCVLENNANYYSLQKINGVVLLNSFMISNKILKNIRA